jgi:nucleotide-binding universal stress UspA family protein
MNRQEIAMRRIIVGVDGSAASRHALAWAVEQARTGDAEVRVVHVWDHPYVGGDTLAKMLVEADDLEIQAQRELDGVVDSVDVAGVVPPVQRVLHCGRPADWLLREAKDADLVVIGQRGLGGVQLGSVGHQVTIHAACPVVVVPAA